MSAATQKKLVQAGERAALEALPKLRALFARAEDDARSTAPLRETSPVSR